MSGQSEECDTQSEDEECDDWEPLLCDDWEPLLEAQVVEPGLSTLCHKE